MPLLFFSTNREGGAIPPYACLIGQTHVCNFAKKKSGGRIAQKAEGHPRSHPCT